MRWFLFIDSFYIFGKIVTKLMTKPQEMFKRISFFIAFAVLAGVARAQTFEVPATYTLEKPADFDYFNKDIVACVDWLIKTPLDKEEPKRKLANAFLLKWVEGHPSITVTLNAEALGYTKKNPELLVIFIGGWAKYMVENPGDKQDMQKGTAAGLRAVAQVYKNNPSVKKDKEAQKFVDLDAQGKLDEWVKANIKKS